MNALEASKMMMGGLAPRRIGVVFHLEQVPCVDGARSRRVWVTWNDAEESSLTVGLVLRGMFELMRGTVARV